MIGLMMRKLAASQQTRDSKAEIHDGCAADATKTTRPMVKKRRSLCIYVIYIRRNRVVRIPDSARGKIDGMSSLLQA